ncbi:MAG: porphobilinogen synthase [Micavibrio aeruginosavorus]|uniref:Delta-aminolevulinic acid dehydratase n=1 Tax=Micavibrio aeruginosavorus TaxID=349221 RepID=A0A2W5MWB8_9BACT|nr:MAG: porphobilinogen synthase [Micavibrio aeruginosavorus]
MSSDRFPHVRMRRLRRTESMRDMVRENYLHAHDMIVPLFVEENITERQPLSSMPGVFRETEKSLEAKVKDIAASGVRGVMLFGVSHNKDHTGSDSIDPNGLLARMINRAKNAAPELSVIADVCFCEYTDHGHCGPLCAKGDVDNDRTIENIAMQSVVCCEAGADMIAPSGMMDGQVSAIRHALDVTGFSDIPIMAYAAKFASCFYGPFRDAAGCALGQMPNVRKDRKSYQMDPANVREALRDAMLDEREGADMLMVKPGMAYLDVLAKLRQQSQLPLAVYQVSGEYAMLKFAAQAGALNYQDAMMESLLAFKRAGADMILTYAGAEAARFLKDGTPF